MAKLRGMWTAEHSPGEIDRDFVFKVDGSFEGFVSKRGKMVPCLNGKFSVNKDAIVVMGGIVTSQFVEGDTAWSCHAVLKGDKIEMKIKMGDTDDIMEASLSRKPEKKDGAAK